MRRLWQCWIKGDHNFVHDYDSPKFNGKCSICGTKVIGNLGTHNVWRKLKPDERRRTFAD